MKSKDVTIKSLGGWIMGLFHRHCGYGMQIIRHATIFNDGTRFDHPCREAICSICGHRKWLDEIGPLLQ